MQLQESKQERSFQEHTQAKVEVKNVSLKLKAAKALSAHEARLTEEEEAHQVQRSRAEDDHDPKPFGRSDC